MTILGPVSGAHLNPAATLVFARRRQLPSLLAAGYVLSQIAGGIAGCLLASAMFALAPTASVTIRSGGSQWLAEVVASFGLVATILAGVRLRPAAVAWLVGLPIAAAYWFTASTNLSKPAVTIARSPTDSFSGIRPADMPAFVLTQCAGALIGAALMEWLLSPVAPDHAALARNLTD